MRRPAGDPDRSASLSTGVYSRCQMVSGSSPSGSTLTFTLRMKKYASTGMTVSATSSDASSAKVTVSAKGRKNWLTMPPTKPSGRNTATVVRVLLVMAAATSRVPDRTASPMASPRARCRKMFSSTTMASSTTRPTATARAPRVMMLMVRPREAHDGQRGEDGQRDAHRRDERRAQAEQEQEDGQDREEGAQQALADQAVTRLLDEVRGVRDGVDLDDVRVLRGDGREGGLRGVGDVDGVGAGGLAHMSVSDGWPLVREKPEVLTLDEARWWRPHPGSRAVGSGARRGRAALTATTCPVSSSGCREVVRRGDRQQRRCRRRCCPRARSAGWPGGRPGPAAG